MSVVLTFSASLSAHAPSTPIMHSVRVVKLTQGSFYTGAKLLTTEFQCGKLFVDLQPISQCACSFFADVVVCLISAGHFVLLLFVLFGDDAHPTRSVLSMMG